MHRFFYPNPRPLLFLSPSLFLVIVAQLVSVVFAFSCSQLVRGISDCILVVLVQGRFVEGRHTEIIV